MRQWSATVLSRPTGTSPFTPALPLLNGTFSLSITYHIPSHAFRLLLPLPPPYRNNTTQCACHGQDSAKSARSVRSARSAGTTASNISGRLNKAAGASSHTGSTGGGESRPGGASAAAGSSTSSSTSRAGGRSRVNGGGGGGGGGSALRTPANLKSPRAGTRAMGGRTGWR